MICVYALVAPSSRTSRATPGVSGLGGERLTRMSFRGVDAVIGTLPSAPGPTADALRRYDRIIRRLASRAPAILPARFGTCLRDLDELEVVVNSRRAAFVRALRLVRNRVQMTVRVLEQHLETRPTGGGVRRPGLQTRQPPSQTPRSGAAYLKARADSAAMRDAPALEPVRQAVRRWVRAERVQPHARDRLVASLYHLIPATSVTAYKRALARTAKAGTMKPIVSGPFPPYAFVDW